MCAATRKTEIRKHPQTVRCTNRIQWKAMELTPTRSRTRENSTATRQVCQGDHLDSPSMTWTARFPVTSCGRLRFREKKKTRGHRGIAHLVLTENTKCKITNRSSRWSQHCGSGKRTHFQKGNHARGWLWQMLKLNRRKRLMQRNDCNNKNGFVRWASRVSISY